ncbi:MULTISPECIES: TerC family protein [Paenibacillus]|uniref:YjbE family integral membrane protein n=1 Tax=Paenibacillus pabuli TaxID=1472 RepID=A0ABX9BSZ1_9BACL|nr:MULTISPECIES: TerC family protein [Paenibacillus]QLG39295.1 TerC family protein [Paenibacillus sp. E222]RAJ03336.1 YjbE family integral membrane protein [Paenibacillus pabuli]SEO15338.1 integral membrane protein, YjbE family [Paenibacillus sp. OK076]
MELFSPAFWLALLNVVFIDLILAGDNAIVIGLAARNLHPSVQKRAILYGTGGALLIRIVATVIVLWLLKVPWLLLVGGLLLIWIAYKLLADQGEEHSDIKAGSSLWVAVRTIVIADAAMGLDNVIAVAGAAQQHLVLVILGLLISVPIIVWGSTLFIKLINHFPWIIYLGAIVLGYTASNMITEEHRLVPFFTEHPALRILFIVLVTGGVVFAGYRKRASSNKPGGERQHSYS